MKTPEIIVASKASRLQRKSIRAHLGLGASPHVSLSETGDMVVFDGQQYSLYFAHGGLQIERAFKEALKAKKLSREQRQQIRETISKLVLKAAGPIIGQGESEGQKLGKAPMPNLRDLMDQLRQAGVTIQGEAIFVAALGGVDSDAEWATMFTQLAATGRKDQILFSRESEDSPSSQELDHILRGYPFTFEQRQIVVQNILVRDAPKSRMRAAFDQSDYGGDDGYWGIWQVAFSAGSSARQEFDANLGIATEIRSTGEGGAFMMRSDIAEKIRSTPLDIVA